MSYNAGCNIINHTRWSHRAKITAFHACAASERTLYEQEQAEQPLKMGFVTF